MANTALKFQTGNMLAKSCPCYIVLTWLMWSYYAATWFAYPPATPPPTHTHTPHTLLQAFYSWIVLNCIPFSVNGDYTHTYLPRQLCTLALSVYFMHAKKWPKRKLQYISSWLVRASSTLVCHVVTSRPCVCVCAVLLCVLFPLLQFANSFTITMLFPFLPFMVKVTRTHTQNTYTYTYMCTCSHSHIEVGIGILCAHIRTYVPTCMYTHTHTHTQHTHSNNEMMCL